MKTNNLLDEILLMLRSFKDNPEKLEKLHQYILNELYTEEDANNTIVVPERFASLVKDTADSLNAGLVCYINPDTLEKIEIPQSIVDTMWFDDEDEEEQDEENDEEDEPERNEEEPFYDDLKRINREWKNTITINPPLSHESFSFMQQFVDSLQEGRLKKILIDALSGRKPFRQFNSIIHQSDKRESWFDFHQKCLENYAAEILAERLWNNESGN